MNPCLVNLAEGLQIHSSGETIKILINNHSPSKKERRGKILYAPVVSFKDSNNSLPPPGKDFSKTPSIHIK